MEGYLKNNLHKIVLPSNNRFYEQLQQYNRDKSQAR
ncbi:hypothetical protein SAMN05421768_104268 [Chryseobacterium joostei]|uniref:Uncharacterized protein n=1 Tax=Chryseobacterium joostei TaxID=112234 RepID=A0A1N7IDP9_9FLAO|nr:hypothetical protein SAMN05421768_104268 [Chryseobacterium joostei]